METFMTCCVKPLPKPSYMHDESGDYCDIYCMTCRKIHVRIHIVPLPDPEIPGPEPGELDTTGPVLEYNQTWSGPNPYGLTNCRGE